MGDCPHHLLDAFGQWALDGRPQHALVDNGLGLAEWPWRDLCAHVRGCDESMPIEVCDALALPENSRYSLAARRLLLKAGDPLPWSIQAVDADGYPCGWTGTRWVRLSGS